MKPLVLLGVLLILAIGIVSSLYVFTQIDRTSREHILERAATIALAVPREDLGMLTGTEEDLGTPAYERVKEYLTQMRSVNRDARFLYLIGRGAEGELFFYADSEPAESSDYSPPGQVYYEATPGMFAVFEEGTSQTEGPDRDRWGLWISGYAPLNAPDGNVYAMLGMDLPAERYLADALAYAFLPFLVSVALTIIVVAMERSRVREKAYLAQREEFLSIASHEIRTPLTGIRWAIEGLLKRQNPSLDPRSRSILVLVHDSCLGLIGRVNNLLDLTALDQKRTKPLRPEPIQALPFLEDLADSLNLSAQQRDVSLVLDPSVVDTITFTGDREMMHHVFFNLLTNAIKYTKAGTRVLISYERVADDHVFRVADAGAGIRPEDQERIFAGYQRTEEAVRSGQYGTGLGLYLVRRAAELHGGSAHVESQPGKGATFVVTLPVTPA